MIPKTIKFSQPPQLSQKGKAQIQQLFLAYQEELGLDLCFQGFKEELEDLPGIYAEPHGAILVAHEDDTYVGVVALKPLQAGVCEMKRLYIKPSHRGLKIGQELVARIIQIGKDKKYRTMKLDTLSKLKAAISLYENHGFEKTEAYNYNPDDTVEYYSLSLV